MDQLKTIIKDYGVLIGSFVGFIFTILALLAKYWFDKKTRRRSTRKKLKDLIKLIAKYSPPTKCNERVSMDILIRKNWDAITNFNHRLTIVEVLIDKIEDDVLKNLKISEIEFYFLIIENVRKLKVLIDESKYKGLWDTYVGVSQQYGEDDIDTEILTSMFEEMETHFKDIKAAYDTLKNVTGKKK